MRKASDQTQRSSWRVSTRTAVLAIAASLALLVLPSAAAASDPFGDLTGGSGGSTGAFGSPTISSDRADYAPGDTVVLTGDSWLPGEHVHITVNDNVGQTWIRESDVDADAGGSIRDEFQLPTSFIAEYAVTATGDASGAAQATFTDGNVKVTASMNAQVTETPYDDHTDCTGNVRKNFPKTETALTSLSGTASIGAGSAESVRLDAAEHPNSPNQAAEFDHWVAVNGDPFTTIAGTGGKGICVPGFNGDGTREYRIIYTAANSTPTVTRDNASRTVNEGQTATNTGTWADADAGDTVTLSASVGTVTKNADGTWSWSYATTDGPEQTQTVTITATDNHGASSTTTFQLNVANVAPAVTAAANQTADEGTSKSFSLGSFTDPGDDGPWAVTVNWGDGSSDTTFTEAGAGAITATSHTYADNGTYTVTVTVAEAGTAPTPSDSKTFTVTVANVAPAVTAAANQTAVEGTSKSFNLGSFGDPGADSPWAVDVDWGDGSAHTTFNTTSKGTVAAQAHTYTDDKAGGYTVTVKVTDKDGASDTKTFTITVANVAPSVTLSVGNTLSWDESTSAERSFDYSVSDPGSDTVTRTITCGSAGTYVAGSDTGSSFKCKFPDGGPDPGTDTEVKLSADDGDGGTGSDTQTVTVKNVAPSVNLSGPDTADEADTKTYTFTLSDPGNDTFSFVSGPPTDYPSCGAHGELVGTPAVTDASFKCRFPDGPNTTDVAIKIKDDDGGESAPDAEHVDIIPVTIANVAPTVTAPAGQSSDEGENKSFALGSFSDPGPDSPWAVDVDWGDGSTHTTFDETAAGPVTDQTITAHSHAYADNGSYDVTVKVTDKDGEVDSKTFKVTVKNVAPTVTLSGPTSANEGDTKSYSYSWTDPGSDDTFPAGGNSVDCGPKGTASDVSFTPASKSGSFKCTFSDDSGAGTFAVTATVTDDDGGAGSDTKNVDVDNVVPTASNGSFVFDPVLGTATAGFDFTDPGTADTHRPNLSYFTWSDVGDRFASVTETNGSGHASDTRTLGPGCYNLTVTGRAQDDDLGMSAALPIYSNSLTSVDTKGFRPPIVDNERNIVKYGNVVPVKVALTNSCTGAAVTNVSLYIETVQGSGGEIIEGTSTVAESVSAADTTGQMRTADGTYIYNLSTKTLTQGKDYTVRIRLGAGNGPIILAAVLQPKK